MLSAPIPGIIPMYSERNTCLWSTARRFPLLLSTFIMLAASVSVFLQTGYAQWVPVNNGLWGARSAVVETGANGVVLAATPTGVYRMENGFTWTLLSPGPAFSSLVSTSTGAFLGLA